MTTRSKLHVTVGALALAAGVATGASGAAETDATAKAAMQTSGGSPAGTVTLQQAANGVLITVQLQNLPDGSHGFHIHETGLCEPDFQAAGGHFSPTGREHGLDNPEGPHAGDLPNIVVHEDGSAAAQFFTAAVTLNDGDTSLFDGDGSAIIVHAQGDSHGQDPMAGGRIACGVIEK